MAEIISAYAFAPIGGGGNPLRAWVLAWFDVVKFFIDCVLGCFNNKLCIKMLITNIVLNNPTCVKVVQNFFSVANIKIFDKSNTMIYAYHIDSINLNKKEVYT